VSVVCVLLLPLRLERVDEALAQAAKQHRSVSREREREREREQDTTREREREAAAALLYQQTEADKFLEGVNDRYFMCHLRIP